MTCIVGLECSDGAIIAGDFCGSDGFSYQTMVPSKVFKHSGMMFGYTSTFRFGQIIEHILNNNTLHPPTNVEDTYRWLVMEFVPRLRQVLVDSNYTIERGCNAVVVVNSQAWELQNDLSILRNDAGLCTVGCGCDHSEASILTQLLTKFPDRRPTMEEAKPIVELAFKVSGSFLTGVSEKCEILTDS